jgi:signal transduction histidine kinase
MPEPGDQIAVLLVDDDEEDYLLTKGLLASVEGVRHEVHWASDLRAAVEAAEAARYDVCLVDYRLGVEDGLDLVRKLSANGHDLPVIVLTGQGDRQVDVEAAQAGAADYLVKGEVGPALLERAIRYAVRRHADLRALRENEEQLRHAQRMEAVGRLAGGVAHDFNNLMSAVIGFSQLILLRLEEAHPLRGEVEQILRAGERATALTSQLLAFSRKQVLQPKVLDLNELVVELEKLLRRLIGANVELVSILDPELGPIEADPGQLEQVILNLVVNARDAMPTGGKATIETSNVVLGADSGLDVSPGVYVLLSVGDSGVGIDEATMGQIFEPFFTTKEEGKGTGLGLATVFGIVKQSGGDIAIESEVGRGTTFNIYLPRATAPVEAGESHGVQARKTGTGTILLVEDEDVVRQLEREVLERSGYTVLEASSPSAALELERGHDGAIDLLLTDVVLPELSGPELAAQLAARRPRLRVLYASGYPKEALGNGFPASGTAFLQKPVTPVSLAQKVRELLDSPGGVSAGSRPAARST